MPGGIGAYARGVLAGLEALTPSEQGVAVTLLASRAPGGRRSPEADPLAQFGKPVIASHLPGPVMTRAWDRRWLHAPEGFDVVHSVSLAAPMLRRGSRSKLVVTVHDVAWRRHPDATTPRGRRWHEQALQRAAASATALVVPSRLVAADLEKSGVDPARLALVPGGTDHVADPDPAATTDLLRRVGVSGNSS